MITTSMLYTESARGSNQDPCCCVEPFSRKTFNVIVGNRTDITVWLSFPHHKATASLPNNVQRLQWFGFNCKSDTNRETTKDGYSKDVFKRKLNLRKTTKCIKYFCITTDAYSKCIYFIYLFIFIYLLLVDVSLLLCGNCKFNCG